MITCDFIHKLQIYDVLPEFVEDKFSIAQDKVIEQIKPIFDKLSDDIVCFVEYPYVDKFYRDSFYSFFSKKHNTYDRNSIRVSFFKDKLEVNSYFKYDNNDEVEELFLGYITLRPTSYRIIGHSFIDPRALKDNSFVCCLSKKSVLINGRKLFINGFPYISRDNESITCSEASIINLLDYFGNKYPEYSILLPSQVNKILSKQSYQRQLPTHGLPTENISYVLKKLGFGTVVYSRDNKNLSHSIFAPDEFKELLFIYIESGIPIIATLSSGNNYHAVLVIGREDIDKDLIYGKDILFIKRSNKIYYHSSVFNKLLVMNDNHPPYEIVDYLNPIYDTSNERYYQFQSFIVPLYSKVHLDAYQFKQFFLR